MKIMDKIDKFKNSVKQVENLFQENSTYLNEKLLSIQCVLI